jgi:hypothetical protein
MMLSIMSQPFPEMRRLMGKTTKINVMSATIQPDREGRLNYRAQDNRAYLMRNLRELARSARVSLRERNRTVMAQERKTGQEQRALLMMFRPRLESRFPASEHDADDSEMLAILKKADRRGVIALHESSDKSRR